MKVDLVCYLTWVTAGFLSETQAERLSDNKSFNYSAAESGIVTDI